MAVPDRQRTAAPVLDDRAPVQAGGSRRVLVRRVLGCVIGVVLLQLASNAFVPDRLGAGPSSVLALIGDLLVAAGIGAATCTMLRLVLPAAIREVAAAVACVALLYLAVVASFAGIDLIAAPTPARDALVALLLAAVLAAGLVIRRPASRPAPVELGGRTDPAERTRDLP